MTNEELLAVHREITGNPRAFAALNAGDVPELTRVLNQMRPVALSEQDVIDCITPKPITKAEA